MLLPKRCYLLPLEGQGEGGGSSELPHGLGGVTFTAAFSSEQVHGGRGGSGGSRYLGAGEVFSSEQVPGGRGGWRRRGYADGGGGGRG